jgi:serine/threonine protein kinase
MFLLLLCQARPLLVDATRISDGKLVYIKQMRTNDEESRIALMLSSFGDPANHSVPISDTFVDPTDENISYLVMPFLRLVDDPTFESIGEILDFVDQVLEVSEGPSLSKSDVLICCPQGLIFMHSKGVAHR